MNYKHTIMSAQTKHADAIRELEVATWGEQDAASLANIHSRIQMWPEGNILVFDEATSELLSYCTVCIVHSKDVFSEGSTWSTITGDGSLSTHDLSGDIVYGVNLSARPGQHTARATALAVRSGQALCIDHDKDALLLGSRIPGFAKWHMEHPDCGASEYLDLHQRKQLSDPLLKRFESLGFVPECVMPNYFPCAESHDNGVIVAMPNLEKGIPLSSFTGGGSRD